MSLSLEEVKHIAQLANLKLSDEELQAARTELGEILTYVEQLSAIQTKGLAPTSHVHGVVNAFRDDIVKESLPLEKVEMNAPDLCNTGFRVPKII